MKPQYTISQAQVQLSALRPIRVQKVSVLRPVQFHDHQYYEIAVIVGGMARHIAEGIDQPLAVGDVMVLQPGACHGIFELKDLKLINIYYLAEWLLTDLRNLWDDSSVVPIFFGANIFRHQLSPKALQFAMPPKLFKKALAEIEEVGEELSGPRPSSTYLKANFTKLLIQFSRAFVGKSKDDLQLSFPEKVWWTIHYIEDCLVKQEAFSQRKSAEKCGLSCEHHRALFKQTTGVTCMEYYQKRRVQFACQMLLKEGNRVSDVVFSLGFNDSAHFSNYFKKVTKLSPREYRKLYGSDGGG